MLRHNEQAANNAQAIATPRTPLSTVATNATSQQFKSKIQRLANLHEEPLEMGPISRAKSISSVESKKSELEQWHKLMNDYERLQFVASSRAGNKLVRSSSESSLDSASNISQASTVVATTPAPQQETAQTPIKPDENEHSTSLVKPSEVGQCLDEMVESVSAATDENEPVKHEASMLTSSMPTYKSFKLREAVLTKTRSSPSDAATTISENSTCDEAQTGRRQLSVQVLGRIELDPQETQVSSRVVSRARQMCQSELVTKESLRLEIDLSGRTLARLDANSNLEPIDLGLVVGCIVEDTLIVWLLADSRVLAEENSKAPEDGGLDLDDIALALNEPIASRPTRGHPVMALVWLCNTNARDAEMVRDCWSQQQPEVEVTSKCTQEEELESHQIEVKVSEVGRNSVAAAEQVKSSGLFVLLPSTSGLRSQLSQVEPVDVEPSGRCIAPPTERSLQLCKSASSLDLTAAQKRSLEQSDKMTANYYKNIANKVLSSGSSKLKSLSQEVSKLNGRQTLVRSARRLSMAFNGGSALASDDHRAGCSVMDASASGPPAIRPRTSVLRRETSPEVAPEPEPSQMVHQVAKKRGHSSYPGKESPKSILKKERRQGAEAYGLRTRSVDDRQTFERRKQRVSCYDITRLMLDEDEATTSLQEKLRKLRAGSTGSVASRARQRRPALLLAPASSQEAERVAGMREEDSPRPKVTTSSTVDGTVRAKVGMSHLRRSASMKVLAQQVQPSQQQKTDGAVPTNASVAQRKKSEFDPRSLRKLPCSETARALREGAPDPDAADMKLARERARRRRSTAIAVEFESNELPVDSESEPSEVAIVTNTDKLQGLARSFNLLRQSFKQRNLSSIWNFDTRRQSMRVKGSSGVRNTNELNSDGITVKEDPKQVEDLMSRLERQKMEAIKVAEANLLAAKQLKQQAQRLREQQKRCEQQQTSIVDSAAILFYSPQVHKQQQQQHQQQQQLIYEAQQQQHLFDPFAAFYQQQHYQQQRLLAQQLQIQQQRQQQQQLAYLSGHSAHFMAATQQHQMAAVVHAPLAATSHSYPLAQMPSVGFAPLLPAPQVAQLATQTAAINQQQRAPGNTHAYHNHLAHHHQQHQSAYLAHEQQNAHFIPMSVNHHSSFNIVYTAGQQHPAPPQPSLAGHLNPIQTPFTPPTSGQDMGVQTASPPRQQHLAELQPPPSLTRAKHSSLGASVRKTMRSILSKSTTGGGKAATDSPTDAPRPPPAVKLLKSALKPTSHTEQSSDGSDGDASSSSSADSSATLVDSPARGATEEGPSSKKPAQQPGPLSSSCSPSSGSSACSPSSSDSSLASSGSTQNSKRAAASLTKRDLERFRKEFIANEKPLERPTLGTVPTNVRASQQRKNVTFSTKLTSIL